MYLLSAHNTAKGYRQIVEDTGIDLRRKAAPPPPKPVVRLVGPGPRDREIKRLKAELVEMSMRLNRMLAWTRETEERYGVNCDVKGGQRVAIIEMRICRALKVEVADVRSNRRTRKTAFARQAIMYWSRRLTDLSYPVIARLTGGRDHSSIIHGVTVYPEKRAAMGRTLRLLR
ncbi:helix-turn-helix domain-containing protein [Mesorhizobium sp. Z1-4]|uniref:helix-turn-helix domain-containing protein n=1 Tax=Mesorhizobium sp. Z1-4 TaxID=2448478 RepID=UPI001FE19FBD|nr:helix-turn-helix domain-containing protein [Mesorhizobium sp. Z1-4]